MIAYIQNTNGSASISSKIKVTFVCISVLVYKFCFQVCLYHFICFYLNHYYSSELFKSKKSGQNIF